MDRQDAAAVLRYFHSDGELQLAVMLMMKAVGDVRKAVDRLTQRLNRKYPTNQIRVYYYEQKIEQSISHLTD